MAGPAGAGRGVRASRSRVAPRRAASWPRRLVGCGRGGQRRRPWSARRPGCPPGSRVPPIASVRPRDSASPSPTPVVLSVSPSRWNGANTRSRSAGGTPGPRSTTRSSTRSPSALAVTTGGCAGGGTAARWPTRLATTRSSRPGSASTVGQVVGHVDHDAAPGRRRGRRAPAGRPRPARPARLSTDSAPACSRLMSSRLSTSGSSRSSDSSAVASSSARSSRRPVDVGAAQAGDRRLGRRRAGCAGRG